MELKTEVKIGIAVLAVVGLVVALYFILKQSNRDA